MIFKKCFASSKSRNAISTLNSVQRSVNISPTRYLPYFPKKKFLSRQEILTKMNQQYLSMKNSEKIPLKSSEYIKSPILDISLEQKRNSSVNEINSIRAATPNNSNANDLMINKNYLSKAYDFKPLSFKARFSSPNKIKVLKPLIEYGTRLSDFQEITRIKQRLAYRNQPISSKNLELALSVSPKLEFDQITSRILPRGGELLLKK